MLVVVWNLKKDAGHHWGFELLNARTQVHRNSPALALLIQHWYCPTRQRY